MNIDIINILHFLLNTSFDMELEKFYLNQSAKQPENTIMPFWYP